MKNELNIRSDYRTASMLVFVVFLVGMIILCNLALDKIDTVLPTRDRLFGKLEWLIANKDKYNAIFIGPSYVQNNVFVNTFDVQMRNRGHRSASFSLSDSGLDQFQELVLLRRLRRIGTVHPKYIFIEPSMKPKIEGKNKYNERIRRLYTIDTVVDGCIMDVASDAMIGEKLSNCLFRLRFGFENYTGVGRLSLIQERISKRNKDKVRDFWNKNNGFIFYSGFRSSRHKRHISKGEDFYKKSIMKISETIKNDDLINASGKDFSVLYQIISEIRQMGAVPVILIAPGSLKFNFPVKELGAFEKDWGFKIFSFANPQDYPRIYKFKNFNDSNHMSFRGAQIFTKILADEFADYVEGKDLINTPEK